MYPVIVSDLDGTLLNKQHQLSARTKEVIAQLSQKGVNFVFATGRHFLDVEQTRAQLGIDMYLITSNGAMVHNAQGQLIFQHMIEPSIVEPVLQLSEQFAERVHSNIYTTEQWLVETHLPEFEEYHKDSGFCPHIANFKALARTDNVLKLFFLASQQADLQPLAEQLLQKYGAQLHTAFSLPTCFEVMATGVNKGMALAEVMKLKGYDLKEAIAFGDGMNDTEMLDSVGKGILMGNADANLVKVLPNAEQIGHCDDNAVAEYLAALYGL